MSTYERYLKDETDLFFQEELVNPVSQTAYPETAGANVDQEGYTNQDYSRSTTYRPKMIPRSFGPNKAPHVEEIKQVWYGVVLGCNDTEIRVRLEDYTNEENSDEEVTLALEEIEEQDQSLIEVGALFFWHIGYRTGRNYPKERFSKIRFRRLAKWSDSELESAQELAKSYVANFEQYRSNHA